MLVVSYGRVLSNAIKDRVTIVTVTKHTQSIINKYRSGDPPKGIRPPEVSTIVAERGRLCRPHQIRRPKPFGLDKGPPVSFDHFGAME